MSMTPGNLTLRCRRLQEDTVCIQPPIYIYSYIIQYYGDAELEPPTAVLNTAAVEESNDMRKTAVEWSPQQENSVLLN